MVVCEMQAACCSPILRVGSACCGVAACVAFAYSSAVNLTKVRMMVLLDARGQLTIDVCDGCPQSQCRVREHQSQWERASQRTCKEIMPCSLDEMQLMNMELMRTREAARAARTRQR